MREAVSRGIPAILVTSNAVALGALLLRLLPSVVHSALRDRALAKPNRISTLASYFGQPSSLKVARYAIVNLSKKQGKHG